MSPVFDEAKYRALLEKLEVREIAFCSLYEKFRFDAEHYQRRFDDFLKIITKKEYSSLQDLLIGSVVTGHTPAMKNNDFYNGDVPFIKTDNLREFCINDNFSDMLTAQGKNELKNSALELNDIVVTIIGATEKIIGRAMLIKEEFVGSCINQNIARIRLKKSKISPEFLTAYLNSKYGRLGLLFNSRQTEQVNLNCREVEELLLPILSENVVNCVTNIVNQALHKLAWTKKIYINTEKLLLQELGLTDWQPDDESVATKTFADFQNSGRLDAEYYQPKYDDLFKRISSYDKSRLGDIVNITKSIEPGSEAYQEDGVPFVRVSDITKFGITPPEIHLDRDKYYSENLTPKKDTILLSKDGSVGIAYKVENDLDVITSGALLHLTVKDNDFLPDYLTLVLNSIVVKLQAERDAGGSIIQHWKPSEIENVIIPKLPMLIQEQIAAKVQESFALRKESKRMLDLAKYAVEVAIEQGEDAAMKLLEEVK